MIRSRGELAPCHVPEPDASPRTSERSPGTRPIQGPAWQVPASGPALESPARAPAGLHSSFIQPLSSSRMCFLVTPATNKTLTRVVTTVGIAGRKSAKSRKRLSGLLAARAAGPRPGAFLLSATPASAVKKTALTAPNQGSRSLIHHGTRG